MRLNAGTAPHGPIEFYDLAADPAEKHSVAPQHPQVIARFNQVFMEAHVPSPVFHFQPAKAVNE